MPYLINNLTNFADQLSVLQLVDGSTANMELIYQGATERWIMNITYGDLTFNGIGICCFPNLLRQWKNILPFGIACISNNQTDPFDINDFSSSRCQLYILTADEVETIESTIFAPTT